MSQSRGKLNQTWNIDQALCERRRIRWGKQTSLRSMPPSSRVRESNNDAKSKLDPCFRVQYTTKTACSLRSLNSCTLTSITFCDGDVNFPLTQWFSWLLTSCGWPPHAASAYSIPSSAVAAVSRVLKYQRLDASC